MLGKTINTLKEQLATNFEIFDEVLNSSANTLASRNFPGATIFSIELERINTTGKDNIIFEQESEALSSPISGSSSIISRFKLYREKRSESDLLTRVLKNHEEKYKSIRLKFKETIHLEFKRLLFRKTDIPITYITLILMLEYGLEMICSISFPIFNMTTSWVTKRDVVENESYYGKLKSGIISSLLGKFGTYETILSAFFDIKNFSEIIKPYISKCELEAKIESATPYVINPSNVPNYSLLLSDYISSGAIDIQQLIKDLTENRTSSISGVSRGSSPINIKPILLYSFLFEIKEFTRLILTLDKDADVKYSFKIIDLFITEQNNPLLGDFIQLECQRWLKAIVLKGEHTAHLEILRLKLIDSINALQIYDFPVGDLFHSVGLKLDLQSAAQFIIINNLSKIAEIRKQYIESFSTLSIIPSMPLPAFENYNRLDLGRPLGGAQEKAPGSGFYQHLATGTHYFIKRTTQFHKLADDLSEILVSALCNYLQVDYFAICHSLLSTTTGDVYVASKCEKGFQSIYKMTSNRPTTRLLPNEKIKIDEKLNANQQRNLLNILLLSILFGDYDANPGNIGTTTADAGNRLVKIDHGWAFDQICLPSMPTWIDMLNPMRYSGRIAPTNSLCDYRYHFKLLNPDLFNSHIDKLSNIEDLNETILHALYELTNTYKDSIATGALKRNLTEADILAALCERFGIDPREYGTHEMISAKLAQSIYYRAQNLHLIVSLEHIASQAKFIKNDGTEDCAVLRNRLNHIIENKIPILNIKHIKKAFEKLEKIIEAYNLYEYLMIDEFNAYLNSQNLEGIYLNLNAKKAENLNISIDASKASSLFKEPIGRPTKKHKRSAMSSISGSNVSSGSDLDLDSSPSLSPGPDLVSGLYLGPLSPPFSVLHSSTRFHNMDCENNINISSEEKRKHYDTSAIVAQDKENNKMMVDDVDDSFDIQEPVNKRPKKFD